MTNTVNHTYGILIFFPFEPYELCFYATIWLLMLLKDLLF